MNADFQDLCHVYQMVFGWRRNVVFLSGASLRAAAALSPHRGFCDWATWWVWVKKSEVVVSNMMLQHDLYDFDMFVYHVFFERPPKKGPFGGFFFNVVQWMLR